VGDQPIARPLPSVQLILLGATGLIRVLVSFAVKAF